MLKAIIDNPFRVLGVYSNAKDDEIMHSLNAISGNPTSKRETDFPIPDLPRPRRDSASISAARSIVFDAKQSPAHKLFWFMKPSDNSGIKELQNGDVVEASEAWFASNSEEGDLNTLVGYLVDGIYDQAAYEAVEHLFNQDFRQKVLGTKESYLVLLNQFKSLLFDESNAPLIPAGNGSSWKQYVQKRILEGLSKQVYTYHIKPAKELINPGNPASYISALSNLYAWTDFRALREFIDPYDRQYRLLMQEVETCAQNWIELYLSSSNDVLKYSNVQSNATGFSMIATSPIRASYFSLLGWAFQKFSEFAISESTCETTYSVAYKLVHCYQNGNVSSRIFKGLIEQVSSSFVFLKQQFPPDDPLYRKLANLMSEIGLTIIEKELRGTMDEQQIADAGSLICYIDRVIAANLLNAPIKERRDKCMNTLWSMGLPTPKLMGLMSWDDALFLNDEESFRRCTTLKACQSYLRRYPNGKHINEVRVLIEKNEFKPYQGATSQPRTAGAYSANTQSQRNAQSAQTGKSQAKTYVSTPGGKTVQIKPTIESESAFKFITIALVVEALMGALLGGKAMLIIGLVLAFGYLLTVFASDNRFGKDSSKIVTIYVIAQTILSTIGLILLK